MPPINESGVLFSHDKVTLNYASKKFCTYLLPQILENEKKKLSYHETSLISLTLFCLAVAFFFVGNYLLVYTFAVCASTNWMISDSIKSNFRPKAILFNNHSPQWR